MTYNEMVMSYQSKMREFKNEDLCRCIRLRSLYDELFDYEEELIERERSYKIAQWYGAEEIELDIIGNPINNIIKSIQKVKMLIRLMTEQKKVNEITPEMIVSARNYPIENIVEVNRGFALCVNHEDKKPSMFTKRNFGYCFVCGYAGDVIDIYIKLHGTSFKKTILTLCK